MLSTNASRALRGLSRSIYWYLSCGSIRGWKDHVFVPVHGFKAKSLN